MEAIVKTGPSGVDVVSTMTKHVSQHSLIFNAKGSVFAGSQGQSMSGQRVHSVKPKLS